MRGEEGALAEVAASVADGESVDWTAADTRLAERERRLIPHLRLVQSIAQLHRTLPVDDDEASAEVPAIRRWGSLVLLDRLGEGTSGEVYRAWDARLHRDVALKLLHQGQRSRDDAQERVLEEARRLARIRHEHVVTVHGVEEHDGRGGLWMELVRGESLDERVRTRGPLSSEDAAGIGRQLCSALAAVHAAGLLHRDVKAHNAIQEPSGRIVLMDFGTGEELRQAAGSTRMVGTPLYLAPEIFKGKPATVQSDIYSLGVLLFYLVTGDLPVKASSMQELGRAHSQGIRQRLSNLRPDLPSAFVGVVERALERDPARRYRTTGEMDLALERSSPAAVATRGRDQERAVAAWGWPFAAAAAALLVVISALIVWTGIGSRPSATRIAVLPVTYESASPDALLIADALTDQLIATLGEIDTLRVTAPASVTGFARSPRPPSEIAAELGVDALLRPVFTVVGTDAERRAVRVDVDLIAAGTGAILWSKAFTGQFGAMRSVHAAIAREAARTLRADVRPAASRRLARDEATTQGTTEAYFEGLYHLKQLTPEHAHLAIAAFERAIELDAEFAPAFAGLARAYVDLGLMGDISQAEARARAAIRIERALQLDADSSEVRVANADLKFYYDWDWPGADQEYQRAIALNPSSDRALFQYARYLAAAGQLDQALDYAERARTVSPRSPRAALTVALMYLFRRDYASALSAIDQATRLDPDYANTYIVRSRILAASGAMNEAIPAARKALSLSRQGPPGWRAHLTAVTALAGHRDEALAEMRQLLADLEQNRTRIGSEHLAYIHLGLNDFQVALDYLERAADERSLEILWLSVDPRVDPLRGDPRFERLLERLRSR